MNWLILRSRSTISFTATDCTRPADSWGFTLRHSTGDSSKPTRRSRMRRACWAFTRSTSSVRGCANAFSMADFVISWKTMRLVLSAGMAAASIRCQEMASPSRSSSVASQTVSASFTIFLMSVISFFFSVKTSYCGEKCLEISMPRSFWGRSRTWPLLEMTV